MPITGACGRKLATLSGLSFEAFLRAFARANVLPAWPGSAGRKGAAFPLAEARRWTAPLRRRFVGGRVVILLGLRTAAAFGVRAGYFDWTRVGGATVAVVPHPSGVNRFFNEPRNVRKTARFMRAVARGAKR